MKNIYLLALLLMWGVAERLSAQDIVANIIHESTVDARDGVIEIIQLGGQKPFTYSWTGPAGFTGNTNIIENLSPGTYCVTVTDALCGTASLCATVLYCNPLLSMNVVDLCPYTHANINLTLGGPGPHLVEWSDGVVENIAVGAPLTAFRNNLPAGNYCVTITDGNGCTQDHCRTIPSVQPIQVSGVATDEFCPAPLGSIIVSVSGGKSPFQYQWSDGATSKDRSNLIAGGYCITVTDANNCAATKCFTVKKDLQNFSVAVTNIEHLIQGPGDPFPPCTGVISVTGTGNSGPFTYAWSNGSNGAEITGLCLGNYVVTVTNQYGCTNTLDATIYLCNGQNGITIENPIITHMSGSGGQTGAIDISINGSHNNWYLWRDQETNSVVGTTQDIQGLPSGTYCVTVTSTGCAGTAEACYTIFDCGDGHPGMPTLYFDFTGDNSENTPSTPGSIDLTVEGGYPPFTYLWSNNKTTQDITGTFGAYRVTVTDHCGRTISGSAVIPPCRGYHLLAQDNCENDPEWKFKALYPGDESFSNEFINSIPPNWKPSPTLCDKQIRIQWPDGNVSNLTLDESNLVNPGEDPPSGLSDWDYDPNSQVLWDVPSSLWGYMCATITNDCGCSNTICDFIGQEHDAYGWHWHELGEVAPPLAGLTEKVIFRCFECEMCTSAGSIPNINDMQWLECNRYPPYYPESQQLVYYNTDIDDPCTGGIISCPLIPNSSYPVPDYINGSPIIDWSATPQYESGFCVFPLGCLFPDGTIPGIEGPVYVVNPNGYHVPHQEGLCDIPAPPGTCNGNVIQDPNGINEDCEIPLICYPSGEGAPYVIGSISLHTPCFCLIDYMLHEMCIPTLANLGPTGIAYEGDIDGYSEAFWEYFLTYLDSQGLPHDTPADILPFCEWCRVARPETKESRSTPETAGNKTTVSTTNKITLYPSPTANRIIINSGEVNISSITIHALNGQAFVNLSTNFQTKNATTEIDLNAINLQKGHYLVKVILENGAFEVLKFVKAE